MDVLDIISKLHPPAVHLPIGGLFLLLMLEFRNIPDQKEGTWIAWWFTILSFIPAAITGLLRAESLESEALSEAVAHGWIMAAAMALTLLAGAIQLLLGRSTMTIMTLWVGLMLMSYGARLGSLMVYGG